jgi:hypothetical protein
MQLLMAIKQNDPTSAIQKTANGFLYLKLVFFHFGDFRKSNEVSLVKKRIIEIPAIIEELSAR